MNASAAPSPSTPRIVLPSRVVLLLSLLSLTLIASAWRYHAMILQHPADPLHGNQEDAVSALADCLRPMPVPEQMKRLREFSQSAAPGLRYAVIDELGNRKSPETAPIVEQAFGDEDSEVRKRALEVLPTLDQKRGVKMLLAGLQDEDTWIREAASTHLLGLLGRSSHAFDKRAVPMLIKSLDDPNFVVHTSAVNILRKLTGNDWRFTIRESVAKRQASLARWHRWWVQNRAAWPTSPEYADVPPRSPVRTDAAPDYEIRDLDGHVYNTASQKGRLTLLNFWSTTNDYCRAEVDDLDRAFREYSKRGVDVVGIVVDQPSSVDTLRQFVEHRHLAYSQGFASPELLSDFGHIHVVPVSVLVDGTGHIRARWNGFRDYLTFQRGLDRVLAAR